MECDGMTREEAIEHFEYVRDLIYAADDDYDRAEEMMYSELGLEMDYIVDLLPLVKGGRKG